MTDRIPERPDLEGAERRSRAAVITPESCRDEIKGVIDYAHHLEAQLQRQEEALRLAVDTIEKLAEQQAMPDGWFDAPLEIIRCATLSKSGAGE